MSSPQQQWDAWVDRACAALGVDPGTVDITAIHALTKRVAHNLDRPLAPVSSYILGVAVGIAAAENAVDPATRDALLQRLLSTVPDVAD
ncbi:MAG: DUF6457 domain-containing protein [Cumulibacter sp.]